MDFIKITEESLDEVIEQLKNSHLPTEDIDAGVELFGLFDDNKLIATAGLEKHGDIALLRSVSTIDTARGKGFGKKITTEIENYIRSNKLGAIYLLTTTAKDFFAKEGYELVNRDETPQEIKQTKQFAGICPSSATIMRKIL